MDITTIKLLAVYNEKTNIAMNRLISQVDAAQWNHDFNAFYPNIFKLCNHIYISDFNWLKRFSKPRSFQYIKDAVFLDEVNYATEIFKTQKEYIGKREQLDKLITTFTGEVTQADLEGNLKYTDFRGTEQNRNFGGLVLSMFNHQTHHRGMISICLEMLGVENDYSSLANFL